MLNLPPPPDPADIACVRARQLVRTAFTLGEKVATGRRQQAHLEILQAQLADLEALIRALSLGYGAPQPD